MDEIMNIGDKRKFIKNFISTQANNDLTIDIISLLDHCKIARTLNRNGLFINLSLVKEDIIEELYSLCLMNVVDSKKVSSPTFTKENTKVDKDIDTFVPCLDKIPLSSIDNFIVDLSTSHLEIGN